MAGIVSRAIKPGYTESMLLQRFRALQNTMLYATCGFLVGLFGGALYTKVPVIHQTLTNEEARPVVADACMYDPNNKAHEAEIFFLSCGGIF